MERDKMDAQEKLDWIRDHVASISDDLVKDRHIYTVDYYDAQKVLRTFSWNDFDVLIDIVSREDCYVSELREA